MENETLKKFSAREIDNFTLVISEISEKNSQIELNKLDEQMESVKKEISDANSKVSQLKQEYTRCIELVKTLDKYIQNNNSDINIICFRYMLESYLDNIDEEILLTKPIELLKKKHKIKKLKNSRKILNMIIKNLVIKKEEKTNAIT